MPSPILCPTCQAPVRLMAVLSRVSYVDYYQCDGCGAVSLAPKSQHDGSGVPLELRAESADQTLTRPDKRV